MRIRIVNLLWQTVIIHETRRLRRPRKKVTPAITANRIMILNLACADFLMGVYLISLGAIAFKMTVNIDKLIFSKQTNVNED